MRISQVLDGPSAAFVSFTNLLSREHFAPHTHTERGRILAVPVLLFFLNTSINISEIFLLLLLLHFPFFVCLTGLFSEDHSWLEGPGPSKNL